MYWHNESCSNTMRTENELTNTWIYNQVRIPTENFLLVGGSNVMILQQPTYNDNEMGVCCLVRLSNYWCHFERHLKSIKLQKYKVVVCSIILSTTYSNANVTLSPNRTSTSLEFSINTNHWRTYQQQGQRRRYCLLRVYASILQGHHFGNLSQARRI